MAAGDEVHFSVGDLVRFIGMADASQNGIEGELVKPVGKDRWVVSPLGDDKGDRTKVVNRKNLEKLSTKQDKGGLPVQPCMYSIVGTWDDWEAHEMRWNAELQSFEYTVTIGPDGKESFKLLLDGDWDACLHPDRHHATPYDTHKLEGPDDGGLDEEWTIGHDSRDGAITGDIYKVRLQMGADGMEKAVNWEREEPPKPVVEPPRSQPAKAPAPVASRSYSPDDRAEDPYRRESDYDRPKYGSCKPTMGWREAESRMEDREAGERMEQQEREARKRLERRLAAAAEAEMLPIEDARGLPATTKGGYASEWETRMRQRRLKEARSRYDERYETEGQPNQEDSQAQAAEEGHPQEGTLPQHQKLKKCVDCGGLTPYARCAACLLLRVHKASWKPETMQAGRGGPQQQPVPSNPREAFDQFWTFKAS